jgi:hypothetical protein
MTDIVDVLHTRLAVVRAAVLSAVDGVGEHDLRRPLTPTGTNLLGLVKHLVGIEHVYFGDAFGRSAPDVLPWVADGSVWDGADLWATPDERSDEIVALYRRACAHSDATITALDIDSPGRVPHWPDDKADTTLGFLLVWVVSETAQHAGHAEIARELVDGRAGSDLSDSGTDWPTHVARVQAAADHFA